MAPLTTNYTYDQADRLTTYNAGPNATTYAYNGDGLRMTKASTLAVTHFSWDIGVEAGIPLLMQDNAGSYIYGPGGILLEEIVPGAGPGTYLPYYYLCRNPKWGKYMQIRKQWLLGVKFGLGFLLTGLLGWFLFFIAPSESVWNTIGIIVGVIFTLGGLYTLAIFSIRFLYARRK